MSRNSFSSLNLNCVQDHHTKPATILGKTTQERLMVLETSSSQVKAEHRVRYMD